MTLKGNRNGMFCIEHENGFSLAIKCESFHTYVFTFVSSEDDENDLSTLQVMQLYQPAMDLFLWKWKYESKKEIMSDGILSCNKELHIQLPANVMMLLPKDAEVILCDML